MKAPKQIVIFFKSLKGYGVEKRMVRLSSFCATKTLTTIVLLTNRHGWLSKAISPDVKVHELHKSNLLHAILPLALYMKNHQPDVVFAPRLPYGLILFLAKSISKAKNVKIVVGSDLALNSAFYHTFKGIITILLCRIFFRKCFKAIAITKQISQEFQSVLEIPKDKIDIIYNPAFDISIIEKTKEPVHHRFLEANHKIVLSVARLSKQKDLYTLIQAFNLVYRKNNITRLIILGEGTERQGIERFISRLNLSEQI
jgi:glycosyltransferase involved in cell wall biosynthesis